MEEHRPDPDKLLQRAHEEEREIKKGKGKLKIYLGAAPGVGKTHEMLHDALEEKQKGLDVVVGVVETHGRQEVDAMLVAFELLPPQVVEYHGKNLIEFDLDGALKRLPQLILIDEMAHSNQPGLRHKKRWQDIKELLDRGIDVYTTLNVQHIESLNDDVAQIIHAPVKETVPDSMIELADTIELVDIPPEELLIRLKEGKVYIPQQAELAAQHFFRKGNLTALRELALLTTAKRVGAQVLLYRQGHGIQHIWPTKEKILVCVGSGPESMKIIRAAKNMATRLQAEWVVVHVDTPQVRMSEESHERVMNNLRFAEQLGAQTRVLTGYDIVKEIMVFSRELNITVIMIWKHIRKRWYNLFFRNLADEIVRNSREIDVYIMTGEVDFEQETTRKPEKKIIPWRIYAITSVLLGVITMVNYFLAPYLSTNNLIMVYLLGVTVVSLSGEMGPSIFASLASVLLCSYFFIPPFYSFDIEDESIIFTLMSLVIVSQIVSQLTIRIRQQAATARQAESQISSLYLLSSQLASIRGFDNILNSGIRYIGDTFQAQIMVLMPVDANLVVRAHYHSAMIALSEKEMNIAQWVYELGQPAGFGTDTLSFSNALYLPLVTSNGVIGVLRIQPEQTELFMKREKMHLLEACVHQIALVLDAVRWRKK
jgi:two-component system sensor histidine kinase KdpD